MLLSRLQGAGITSMVEEQAQHALAWYPEDLDKAYDLLVLVNESFEGELKDFSPDVRMVGAVNRNMVTCYLDALLFAMFARLDSFEAMVYDEFADEPRKKLAAILRLWINLLRTGQLIKIELVGHHSPRKNPTDAFSDKTLAGHSCAMWLGGSRPGLPTRCLRSLHIHHRRTRTPTAYAEDGHIPHRTRKQGGRPQIRE